MAALITFTNIKNSRNSHITNIHMSRAVYILGTVQYIRIIIFSFFWFNYKISNNNNLYAF